MKAKKVCVIGGSGIKNTVSALRMLGKVEINSIVSVFDSGGHTGLIRKQYGIYAIGDIRDNLIASSKNGEIATAFSTRAKMCGSSQNLGNLILTGLINERGNDYINVAHELLEVPKNIRVIPIIDNVKYTGDLVLKTNKGELIGEHNLDLGTGLKVYNMGLSKPEKISNDAKKAIENADFIVFGPGDIFSSILPNTLVDGFTEALKASKAKKILILNIMNKVNETDGFKASDFLSEFRKRGIEIDVTIANKKKLKNASKKSKYGKLSGFVKNDVQDKNFLEYDLIDLDQPFMHNLQKLAAALKDAIMSKS